MLARYSRLTLQLDGFPRPQEGWGTRARTTTPVRQPSIGPSTVAAPPDDVSANDSYHDASLEQGRLSMLRLNRPVPTAIACDAGPCDSLPRRSRRTREPHGRPRKLSHVDDEDENPGNLAARHVGSPPVSLRIHCIHVCPKSTLAPYIIGQAPAITLMSC
jgi:hypothetical protein